MARPAPSVDRTVGLITFLSRHPGRSFGLSELARRLDLNKATAHSMLVTLSDAGWLLRDPEDKSYRLGASLVAIGDAAAATERHALEIARPHMVKLSEELGVQVVASTVMGDEIVILAVDGHAAAPMGFTSRPGYRVPLSPPFGTVFMAWSDAEGVERWLHRLQPDLDPKRTESYRRALDVVRRRGYTVTLAVDQRRNLGRVLDALGDDVSNDEVRAAVERVLDAMRADDDYLLVDFGTVDSYQLGMISAPVFDRAGHVALAITVTAFPRRLTSRQVPSYGRRLTAVTAAVTTAIGGRPG